MLRIGRWIRGPHLYPTRVADPAVGSIRGLVDDAPPSGRASDPTVGPTIPVFDMVVKYPILACPLARDCVEWFIRRLNLGCHDHSSIPGTVDEPREQ